MWPNIEKGKVGDSEKFCIKVWDLPAVVGAGKEISNTIAAEKCESGESNTVGNFMLDRVFGMEASSEFLDYCATSPYYGWSSESDVTIEEFKNCLKAFKRDRPEYAHYVRDC